MKNTSNLRKIASISLAFLISASYAANAMEGKEEGKELTARVRAEVARVLGNFQHNMNAYYARTGNPKRVTIAEEYSKKQAERTGGEEPLMPPRKKLDSSNSNNTTAMTTTFLPVEKEENGIVLNSKAGEVKREIPSNEVNRNLIEEAKKRISLNEVNADFIKEAADEMFDKIIWVPSGNPTSPSFNSNDIGHFFENEDRITYGKPLASFMVSRDIADFLEKFVKKFNENMVPNKGFGSAAKFDMPTKKPNTASNKMFIATYIYQLLLEEVKAKTKEKLQTEQPLLNGNEIQEAFNSIEWQAGVGTGFDDFTVDKIIAYIEQKRLDIYANDLFSSLASDAGRNMIHHFILKLRGDNLPTGGISEQFLEKLKSHDYGLNFDTFRNNFVVDSLFNLLKSKAKAKSKLAASPAK